MAEIHDEKGNLIIRCHGNPMLSMPNAGDTADRVIAAWNACEGYSTEKLQDHIVIGPATTEWGQKAAKELTTLRAANKVLAEALQEFLAAEHEQMPPYESGIEAQNAWANRLVNAHRKARAALQSGSKP